MNHEHLVLPHPGYVLPSPFTPYQPGPAMAPFSVFPSQSIFPSPPPPILTSSATAPDAYTRYTRLPSSTSLSSDLSIGNDKDFRIVTWEELKTLLPDAPPDARFETGLLSDGRAYAQKTAKRDMYCLFPSKSAYILYFLHHYFSRENLDRDQTFRRMMTDNAVPAEKIVEAPRLASIGTTVDDLKRAIETGSSILCTITGADTKLSVKRVDNYPGINPSPTGTIDAKARASIDSAISNIAFSEHQSPSPVTSTDVPAKDEYSSQATVTTAASVYANNHPYHPFPSADFQPQQGAAGNAFIRPSTARHPNPAAINSTMAAAMAAMNFGHHPTQHPPPSAGNHQMFGHLPPPHGPPSQTHIAAAMAALSQQRTALVLATHAHQYVAAVAAQNRGQNPQQAAAAHQLYHQQRRTPPSTGASGQTPSPQQPGSFYKFPAPFYPFHHDQVAAAAAAAAAAQFGQAYQPTLPQHYDQWGADAISAALAAGGFNFPYAAAAPPPPTLSNPHHPPMMLWSQGGTGGQLKSGAVHQHNSPMAPTPTTVSSTMAQANGADEASGAPGVGAIVHPCAKDDPSIVAVTDGGEATTAATKKSPPQPAPTSGSLRPNSGGKGGGGGIRYKNPKGNGSAGGRPMRSSPATTQSKESAPTATTSADE